MNRYRFFRLTSGRLAAAARPIAGRLPAVRSLAVHALAGAICAAALSVTLAAASDLPAPSVGTIRPEAIEAARRAAATAPLPSHPGWEDTDQVRTEAEAIRARAADKLNSDDNDTVHYARGMTLVVHLFVDHNGGTWTDPEREAAAAKAAVAKEHYMSEAPGGANVHFDFEGSDGYYYYNVDYNGTIPESGMTSDLMEIVCGLLGRTDVDGDGWIVDDFSLALQDWNGGWDNVIFAFEGDVTGRAWASGSFGRTALYTDDTGNVWAHEWGHLFGACDEYEEDGHCNGSVDCGPCQSAYLDDVIDNGNCEMVSCGTPVACIMNNNTFSNICDYTLNHWGWVDEDGNGVLDWTKRRTSGSNFVQIHNIPHNGNALWNNTTDGYAIAQQWTSWMVAGLRSPASANYNLYMYGDNNHNYLLAASAVSNPVDFVVGDYNHSRIGNEHLRASRVAGDNADYRLHWESGTGVLYPDGEVVEVGWQGYQVVRAYDLPLFGGESVNFTLDITSGNLDMGMALFKSDGTTYYASRTTAQWVRDAAGVGVTESWSYDVPADDVYGLIVFANSAVDGTFTLKIGPSPVTLAEETPFNSGVDLRLFNYDPNAFSWSVAGVRGDAGTNTTLRLFSDADYQNALAISNDYSGVEFAVADYNASYNRDYLRVIRESGAGNHATEWEHDNDILTGVDVQNWLAGHVAKVWDMYLEEGTSYFFRSYCNNPLDTGIYLFSSADGDRYHSRNEYAAGSNSNPPENGGGEWFSYTPPANDWYGLVQIVNDGSNGFYSLYAGPRIALVSEALHQMDHDIVWGNAGTSTPYWSVQAVRPATGTTASVTLYSGSNYDVDTQVESDPSATGVAFTVVDRNHAPGSVHYPRFRRLTGTGTLAVEAESGTESLVYMNGDPTSLDWIWLAGDVADAFDVFIDGSVPGGRDVVIQVWPLAGSMDLGVSLFSSQNGDYYQDRTEAVAASDAGGAGQMESISWHAAANDYYGLVVYNKNGNGGTYRITIDGPSTVSVDPPAQVPDRLDLRTTSANPFREEAQLRYDLPAAGPAELAIFDVHGRRMRTLLDGPAAAGSHRAIWDGRDERGDLAPAGLYFARLRSAEKELRMKLIRAR